MSKEYDRSLIPNAQKLRREMTKQERKLWYEFLSEYPVRFQRQKTIGHYIVDFYCHAAQLVVEIDGGQHYEEEALRYDRRRTAYLEGEGLQVLRVTNLDLDRNPEGVCFAIEEAVKKRTR